MGKRSREKQAKRAAQQPAQPAAAAATAVPMTATAAGPAVGDAPESAPQGPGFLDRHPQVATLILIGVWLYVAALCLLALDQWFGWGIFGPKPVPLTP